MAQLVRNMGLKVDVQKLKELTGLQFISDEEDSLWTPERTDDKPED